ELWLIKCFGIKWAMLGARGKVLQSRCRIGLWRFIDRPTCYNAFRELILIDLVRSFRLKKTAEENGNANLDPRLRHAMSEDLAEHLVGCHAFERTGEGKCFKQTKRVSILRVALPAGDYRVDIEMLACRPAHLPSHFMAFFDENEMDASPLDGRPNSYV